MAITGGNLAAITGGTIPSGGSNVVVVNSGATGGEAKIIRGTATFVGDGAASTANLNFIDGTLTLPFTPGSILFSRTGGTATATITATNIAVTDASKAAVTFSAAPANAATVILAVEIRP
jgi:hypothetical protein